MNDVNHGKKKSIDESVTQICELGKILYSPVEAIDMSKGVPIRTVFTALP